MSARVELDPAALDALRDCDTDGTLLAELVAIFREEVPARLAAMRGALDAGDAQRVGREAHTLISGSAQFGAMRLARLCRELQRTAFACAGAPAGSAAGLEPLVRAVAAEAEAVLAALDALLAPPP